MSSADSLFAKLLFGTTQFIKTDSGLIIRNFYTGGCKNYFITTEFIGDSLIVAAERGQQLTRHESARPKLFSINGNISYDFIYRSRIDTPVSQRDFQQHTERVNLDVLVSEKYPLKVAFISRQSNSPFFRNYLDMNMNFDRYKYNNSIRQDMINRLSVLAAGNSGLKSVTEELSEKLNRYNALKGWLGNGATLQKIIEEKEKKYRQQLINNNAGILQENKASFNLPDPESDIFGVFSNENKFKFNTDRKPGNIKNQRGFDRYHKDDTEPALKDSAFIKKDYIAQFDEKQRDLSHLADSIKHLQQKADSMRFTIQRNMEAVKQKIYKATTISQLKKIAAENNIQQGREQKLERFLSGIRTFGIGRSMLNYTELTAQYITVTGINIEFNPSYYVAFASGKIDYRFRDFYTRNGSEKSNQYLALGRLGIGDKDSKAIIFSLFQGRKSTSQFGISDSIAGHVNIMGYSIEAILKKDANTSISAEFAKSTKPVTGTLQDNKQTGVLFKFADNSNMGISFKAQTIIAGTNTKLSGFYRRTGKSFQSFSLFSYNTNQTAWLARADQPFFRSKVMVTGMLRQNDFTNPFTDKTFKTSTTFKSILVSVRIPKYPALSVGYYPGTQLYFIDRDRIRENAYYILNGSLVYSYIYRHTRMNSSILYNRYFNKATDSGFVLNTGINCYASQTLFLKKIQLKAGYAFTRLTELSFYTIESSADYALRNYLKIGAGIKYNKVADGNFYLGQQFLLSLDCKSLGGVTLQYERNFLPSLNNTLVPFGIGRISWYKIL